MGRFTCSVIVDCDTVARTGARVFDVGLVCTRLYSVQRQGVKLLGAFNCCLETGSGVSKVSLFSVLSTGYSEPLASLYSASVKVKECLINKFMSGESVRSLCKFVFDLNMSCVVPN